jgi:hypothetical protein
VKKVIVRLALLAMVVIRLSFAQNLSIGAAVGTHFTPNFQPSPAGSRLYYTDARIMFGGAVAEWSFVSAPVSIEVDGLYRRLHALIPPTSTFSVVTWEYPVLANYRVSVAGVNALLEAGPSFRSTGNLNDIHPSHYGFTAGLGVEMQVGQMRIAPLARYTHWGPDQHPGPHTVRTKVNQLELLVALRSRPLSNEHPFGSRLSFGFVVGTNLSSDFRNSAVSELDAVRGPLANIGYRSLQQVMNARFSVSSGPMSFLGGPLVSFQLPEHLTIEAQAVYRPLRSQTEVVFVDGRSRMTLQDHRTSWEIPLLAQYHWRARLPAQPFVELGPAFRVLQDVYGASPFGVAAGTGVSTRVGHLKIAPGLRFTHWARPDPTASTDPRRNELAVLTGFSF